MGAVTSASVSVSEAVGLLDEAGIVVSERMFRLYLENRERYGIVSWSASDGGWLRVEVASLNRYIERRLSGGGE